jgi:biopolymer transport protein ExbB
VVKQMLEAVERGDADRAISIGKGSPDFVAQIIVESLKHREQSLSNAFTRAANQQLTRYQQGLATLDTCITAAPLLGLLGTVTGMMRTFGALGGGDIGAAAGAITGGVAEALIATAAGLAVAVLGLFPYNYLNTMDSQAKLRVSDASHALEIFTKKSEGSAARH